MNSIFCQHSNEAPKECPCDPLCSCKNGMCSKKEYRINDNCAYCGYCTWIMPDNRCEHCRRKHGWYRPPEKYTDRELLENIYLMLKERK